jgi:hypothetical protein
MSRNVLKCLNEPSERFILPLSFGVRRSEQIFTCVADRAVWVCMLGLWDFQCRRGGSGGQVNITGGLAPTMLLVFFSR